VWRAESKNFAATLGQDSLARRNKPRQPRRPDKSDSAPVRTEIEIRHYGSVQVFSLPIKANWRCYTAVLSPEDAIASTGSMLIDEGVAQLGLDATQEEYRGRGANKALLRRRLADAAEAGCHTVFAALGECEAEQFDAAAHNLLCAGFIEAYRSHNWQRPSLSPAARD
jgi:GNAT superfamily N-acetyltransferase